MPWRSIHPIPVLIEFDRHPNSALQLFFSTNVEDRQWQLFQSARQMIEIFSRYAMATK